MGAVGKGREGDLPSRAEAISLTVFFDIKVTARPEEVLPCVWRDLADFAAAITLRKAPELEAATHVCVRLTSPLA